MKPPKQLLDKWYKKLKNSGFDDIENEDGRLRTGANNNIENIQTVDSFENRQEYYRLVGHFLHEHQFKSAFDRIVWQLHGEGKSTREIVAHLKSKNFKVYSDKVNKAILALRKAMKVLYGVTSA